MDGSCQRNGRSLRILPRSRDGNNQYVCKLLKLHLFVQKSFFEVPNDLQIKRNQIDYPLQIKLYNNYIKRIIANSSYDLGTDYDPFVADLELRLKFINIKLLIRKI